MSNKKYIITIVSFLDKNTFHMYNIYGCDIEKYIDKIKTAHPKSAIFIDYDCVYTGSFNNRNIKQCINTIVKLKKVHKLNLKFIHKLYNNDNQ